MSQLPLFARALSHATRVAFRTMSDQYSYDGLVKRSQSIARGLLTSSQDLEESRVAYLVPPGFEYATTQWGIWLAGGIAVPLSLSATEKELEHTLVDSAASVLVTTRDFASRVDALCQRLHLRLMTLDDLHEPIAVTLPKVDLDRRAMILYTSGTTNKPKGVVTTHRCIQAQIESLVEAWQWQTDDCIPLFLPLHHIHGIINIMSCALWSGAIVEPHPRFDLETVLRRVTENAYSVFMAVPTIYVKLIAALESMPVEKRTPIVEGFAGMRLMVSGSAALPASVHSKWTELTGQKLLERYGMTEIGMALSNPYHGERRPGTVGQPLPGVELRLRADQNGVPGEDQADEIQVRGPSVFKEYWGKPAVTREAFDEGWFRTGDIAVLEDGYYRILGRSSVDIIKSGGYKLSALEIEATLLDHPAIRECAVVGLGDDTWGETVAAALVWDTSVSFELSTLKAWCQQNISSYKIPRHWLNVASLPRNSMGKVTKPAVKALFTRDS
ncbi:MAG: acyl-CoA synthetase [Planctomycetota bacterium]